MELDIKVKRKRSKEPWVRRCKRKMWRRHYSCYVMKRGGEDGLKEILWKNRAETERWRAWRMVVVAIWKKMYCGKGDGKGSYGV